MARKRRSINNKKNHVDIHANAFGKNITTVYGLNLALSYENAAFDRLSQRISECTVPEVKKNLQRHLKQTKEQQNRLRQRIEILTGAADLGAGKSDDFASLVASHEDTMKPTDEKGRLPVPEPPDSLKRLMDTVGTDAEREVWESVNDLIVERGEVIMYRAGIDALRLLDADKKTIDVLRKNLKEEEAFAKWLEKNNPKVAKKLMKKQMRHGKKKKTRVEITIDETMPTEPRENIDDETTTIAADAEAATTTV
jgi:ferritin-like metal-binding protein YciE